jgi:hypothetical protein
MDLPMWGRAWIAFSGTIEGTEITIEDCEIDNRQQVDPGDGISRA